MKNQKGLALIELLIFIMIMILLGMLLSGAYERYQQRMNPEKAITLQVEAPTPSTGPEFKTACYNGVLYFTTRSYSSLIEYPVTPVLSPTSDRLRPTLCLH